MQPPMNQRRSICRSELRADIKGFESAKKESNVALGAIDKVTGCGLMRVFKTKWFTKAAKSHAIKDSELCKAIEGILQGKVDDLGGGVYKKRLNLNRDRAIILAKGGCHWFYTFLYAKQDMANIDARELMGFRELAKHYAGLADVTIMALIQHKELVEICHDCKK